MKKSNSAFYGFLALVIVAACFFYTWKFLIPKYSEDQSAKATLEDETTAAESSLESLQQTKTSLERLGNLPEQLSLAVPNSNDTPNFITELEAIGVRHNIVIPSFQIADGSSGGSAAGNSVNPTVASSNVITCTLSINGSFENLTAFMNSIEKNIRFMSIKSVTLNGESSNQNDEMSLTIQVEAYKSSGSAVSPEAASSGSSNAAPTE